MLSYRRYNGVMLPLLLLMTIVNNSFATTTTTAGPRANTHDARMKAHVETERTNFLREHQFQSQHQVDEFIEEQKRLFLQKEGQRERERLRREREWKRKASFAQHEEYEDRFQSRSRENFVKPPVKSKLQVILEKYGINANEFLDGIHKHIIPSTPRDVFQGIRHAVQSVTYGSLISLISIIAFPWMGHLADVKKQRQPDEIDEENNNNKPMKTSSPFVGLIVGMFFGSTVSVVSLASGVLSGVYQICRGVAQTPTAVYKSWYEGQRWDDDTAAWLQNYSLSQEAVQIEQAISGIAPVDTTYYQLLQVHTNATSSQIKKAYFAKAKQLHPDKNIETQQNPEQFLQLHEAYQTLKDSNARARYDASGINKRTTAAENKTGGSINFNVHIFFTILFGSYEAVEQFVGEFSVASFVDRIIAFGQRFGSSSSSTTSSDDSSTNNNKNKKKKTNNKTSKARGEALWQLLFPPQTQQTQRQVSIAQFLQTFVANYNSSTTTSADDDETESFIQMCQAQADLIYEQSGDEYGPILLQAIGRTVQWEASKFLGFHSYTALVGGGLYSWTSQYLHQWYEFLMVASHTWTVGKGLITSVMSMNNNNNNKKDVKSAVTQEVLEELLPNIMDMAWAFNLQDISKTLEKAVPRLLDDSYDNGDDGLGSPTSLSREAHWKRSQDRAKALQLLGKVFTSRAKQYQKNDQQQCSSEGEGNDSCQTKKNTNNHDNDTRVRLMVAYKIAVQASSGKTNNNNNNNNDATTNTVKNDSVEKMIRQAQEEKLEAEQRKQAREERRS